MGGSYHQHVSNIRHRTRKVRPAVWLDGHGGDQIDSVSVAATNKAGNPYGEIPYGQVLGYDSVEGMSYPLAYTELSSSITSVNVIPLDDADQVTEGDLVLIDDSFFRTVTNVDYDAQEITVDGAALTLAAGVKVESDPSRGYATVKTTAAAPGAATTVVALEAGQAARFKVGELLQFGALGTKAFIFTPTVADDEDFEIHAIVETPDGPVSIDLAINSGSGATAQSIVEALDAQADAELPAGLAVGTEDDSVFTLTITDAGLNVTMTFTDNLTRSVRDKATAKISAIDTGADTVTVDADLPVTAGDLVISARRGGYELTTETVAIFQHTYIPDNVLVPTRSHGRVREASILGLTPAAKAEMRGLIKFI